MVFGVEPRPRTPKKGAAEGRPSGAFGQDFPQNVPSPAASAAVAAAGVKPVAGHAEAERVDTEGLPHVGAVVWPGQSYYTTLNKTNGALLCPEESLACTLAPSFTWAGVRKLDHTKSNCVRALSPSTTRALLCHRSCAAALLEGGGDGGGAAGHPHRQCQG